MSHDKKETQLDVKDDEKHLLLDHAYDGLQELNHPLPSWWVWIWIITIVHSIGYFVYYEFLQGPSLKVEFQKDYARVMAAQEIERQKSLLFKLDKYLVHNNPEGLKKAHEVFEMNCVPCHAEGGKGDIGPNLTDDHWIVAKGTPESIYDVIYNGSLENGMPEWGTVLTNEEIYLAVTYVMSVKNKFIKGKAPQGERIVENK